MVSLLDQSTLQESEAALAKGMDEDEGKSQSEAWRNLEDKFSIAPMTSESLEAFAENVDGVMGTGVYPILTLANHDCSPNASIEFLGESSLGSMVARRRIKKGQEITITYVPAGDDGVSDGEDCHDYSDDASDQSTESNSVHQGSEADRFKHFKPTRTWEYFSKFEDWDDEDDDDDDDDEEDDNEFKGMLAVLMILLIKRLIAARRTSKVHLGLTAKKRSSHMGLCARVIDVREKENEQVLIIFKLVSKGNI